MNADPIVLERIFDRLVRTLSAGGPDQLRAPFTVSEITQSLVPYRTYRHELGVDTLQDYEHAILEILAGERGWLVCDSDTVDAVRRELSTPDPDTGILRRIQAVEVRMGAIRMPVVAEARTPTAVPITETPRRSITPEHADALTAASKPASGMSDAVVIGAVMDREDRERADATAREASATPPGAMPSLADLPVLPPAEPQATTPLLSMHGVTQANAQTLSRITPLSVPSVYGDPIEFRGVRHAPVDIGGVIFLFGMVARELGFNVEAMSSGFPRCEAKRQVAPGKWSRLRIDFELESRQFRDAGRNPAACDLIVCWRETWPDRPASIDVLSLERILPTLGSRD
jgi:hypothetical protein